PQARLHTQFPGTGQPGDAAFDTFYAGQFPSLVDFPKQQALNRDALVALLDKIGPAILLTHAQSGAFAWPVGDARPQPVKAIIAGEPSGPPVRDVEMRGGNDFYVEAPRTKPFGLGDVPLTFDPPLPPETSLEFVRQDAPERPDRVRCWQQKEPTRRLV